MYNNELPRGIGDEGEDSAAAFLRSNGYTMIARNYTSRFGEIDIIAQKNTYIIFVEVKTRKANSLVGGIEAVSISKQRKIIKTAMMFMANEKINLQPRFDIIEVVTQRGFDPKINHLENAFDSEGFYGF